MTALSCLGFFTTPVIPKGSMNSSTHILQDAVFHCGRHNIHVLCSNYEKLDNPSQHPSQHLGPLIGDFGIVSEPLTPISIQEVYIQIFYMNVPTENTYFVHGFVLA